MTREEYLNQIIKAARPMFRLNGKTLPRKIRAAVSLPQGRSKAIGLCWSSQNAEDGAREIWVSATIDDPMRVADVMVHELCHAALPDGTKHGPEFVALARAMQLEGKPTSTHGGFEFQKTWKPILRGIGKYPGRKFTASEAAPKQSTRLIKAECDDCGFVFRTTRKWVEGLGEAMNCFDRGCSGHMDIEV